MCYLEVDLNQICQEFALPQNHFAPEIALLAQLEKDGLVRLKNNKIKINLAAPQICRVVAAKFDKFFEANAKRHSRVA
jgi:coproporphyrinogen III oxidase-like Fe-S oxidoreductase